MRNQLRTYQLLLLIGSLLIFIGGCSSTPTEEDLGKTQALDAIVWHGGSTAALDAETKWGDSLTIKSPPESQPGDFMIAVLVTSDKATVRAPNGWTLLKTVKDTGQTVPRRGVRTTIFWRAWGRDEPESTTFSFSKRTRGGATLQAYANVDTADPIDAITVATEDQGRLRHFLPKLTTSVPGTVLLGIAGILSPQEPANASSNMRFERVDRSSGDAGSWGAGLALYQSEPRANAGRESGRYIDSSAETDTATMIFLALKPKKCFTCDEGNDDLWIPANGAWLSGWGNHGEQSWTEKVEAHEARIGRKLDVLHNYHPVGNLPLNNAEKAYIRSGRKLFINWKPAARWADAAGRNATINAQIDQVGRSLKSVAPAKVMVALYHEPEDNVPGAGQATDYVAMWRNVRSRWDALGVDNVIYVWNVMGYLGHEQLYNSHALWPGDEYVDWVMWNPYSRGENPALWEAKIKLFYTWLIENSAPGHNYAAKPWGLGEWGVAKTNDPGGAFEQQYYRDMQAKLPDYPQLKLIAIFDSNTDFNYYIDHSSAELNAYRALAADPYLNQPNPGP